MTTYWSSLTQHTLYLMTSSYTTTPSAPSHPSDLHPGATVCRIVARLARGLRGQTVPQAPRHSTGAVRGRPGTAAVVLDVLCLILGHAHTQPLLLLPRCLHPFIAPILFTTLVFV